MKTVNEAADEWADSFEVRHKYKFWLRPSHIDAFLAGAEWMRQQFKLWGTDDCIEPDCEGGGRCTMYVTLEGRCIGCAHKHSPNATLSANLSDSVSAKPKVADRPDTTEREECKK